MLVGEHTPAPRVVAGLRKLRPELTPGPVPTPADPSIRISGVLRQYYNDDNVSWAWVRAAVRGGCLLAWRDGTLPRRPAARLPLRHLHLRAATSLPNAFQLSRLRDDTSVATFQACNATEYARWVRALCVEILGQTPLPQVRFLDVLSATDTCIREPKKLSQQDTPSCPPRPPPRARRRLITAPETYVPRRDHSPAATDEGIVVEDDDYDSSSDRSLDLSLSLDALKNIDTVDAPVRTAEIVKCNNCSKLNSSPPQHHTLPRAARSETVLGPHRYLKRWEGSSGRSERGRYVMEAAKRKAVSLENRARSCSPSTHEVVSQYIPVKERRALFESLSQSGGSLARSSEQLSRPIETEATPRRAASLHDLQAPPTRSVSDLRKFFEAVARGSTCSTLQRQIVPPSPVLILPPYTSLTCA